MGGGSTIQHLQSDVRGSAASAASVTSSRPPSGYHSAGGGAGASVDNSRRGSAADVGREALPSPSRSTSPPHSHDSRPNSAEAGKQGYHHHQSQSHSQYRRPSMDAALQEKQQGQLARGSASKREEEYDEMDVEVDEIENDMDT